jgi:DNA mismatch repair protein MutL
MVEGIIDKFLYDIACKASIKAGNKTDLRELSVLIDEYLKNTDKLKYCPHGRPIIFNLSKKNIEKQFKRIFERKCTTKSYNRFYQL